MPRSNDLQAADQMKKIIYDAYDKLTTKIYDDIQAFQNNIRR
jgi:beta-mannanase